MLLKYFFGLVGVFRLVISADILLLRSGGGGCMGVHGGGVEKLRLKLTSAKVEVEVEAEIGKY